MEIDLSGRTALVTGAASGIGAACTAALVEAGARVIAVDLAGEALDKQAAELGSEPVVADLLDDADLTRLEPRLAEVDILVNNAGIQHVSPVEEFPPEKFAAIVSLMLVSPFRLARGVLPGMYSRNWGRIVNISSVHGLRASPFKSAYVAAKHGLEGLSKVIALEGGGRGVTSVCVSPGYVRTPLVDKQIADQARSRGIDEQDVLEQVLLAESAVKRLAEPEE